MFRSSCILRFQLIASTTTMSPRKCILVRWLQSHQKVNV